MAGRATFALQTTGTRVLALAIGAVLLGSCGSSSGPGSSDLPELAYVEGSIPGVAMHRIVLVRADGTGRRVLWEEPPGGDLNYLLLQFTPDGDTLLYHREANRPPAPQSGWWLVPLDGGQPRPFAAPVEASPLRFAPAGNLMAWGTSNGDLSVAPRGSTALVRVIPDTMRWNGFDWSPDGTRMVVALQSDQQTDLNLFLVNAFGGEPVPLVTTRDSWDSKPRWAPDGALIAYVREDFTDCGTNCGLWVIAQDGSGSRRALPGGIVDHVWTSDSRQILVTRRPPAGPDERGLLDVSTGDFRPLDLFGPMVERPISSDDRYLLFTARSSINEPAVAVSAIDGSERRQVHPDSVFGLRPVWRP